MVRQDYSSREWVKKYFTEDPKLFLVNDSLNPEDLKSFALLRSDYFSKFLKEKLGFNFLSETDLITQFRFLNFLKNKNEKEFNKIGIFAKKFKKSGLKTFLSIEHGGQEMGDKILSLAEKLTQEDSEKIFSGYSGLVDSAEAVRQELEKAISNSENKSELSVIPVQVYESLLMRTKDILIGAEKIASGNTKEKFVVKDVLDATEGMKIFLDIISDLDQNKNFEFKKTSNDVNLFKYTVTDKSTGLEYGLKFFIRSLPELGAQARINMELSFDTTNPNENLKKAFYNETVFYTQGGKKASGSVVRIGIDRDDNGIEPNVSLDIGRSEHSGEKFTRTGDVLGRLLVHATDSHIGHHTTEAFDKKFAEQETFAKIADAFKVYLESK